MNKNPENYFAEVEQVAFSPSHLVPGIDASADRMLQGRLFSYPDTHRHRLGANYQQIPINAPKNANVQNYQRDGFMVVNGNGGGGPNYGPNSYNGPAQNDIASTTFAVEEIEGMIGRFSFELKDDDFVQAGNLYRLLSEEEKKDLVNNIAGDIASVKKDIIERQLGHFERADPDYRKHVEAAIAKLQKKQ